MRCCPLSFDVGCLYVTKACDDYIDTTLLSNLRSFSHPQVQYLSGKTRSQRCRILLTKNTEQDGQDPAWKMELILQYLSGKTRSQRCRILLTKNTEQDGQDPAWKMELILQYLSGKTRSQRRRILLTKNTEQNGQDPAW